jgi:peptidase E
MNFILFSAGISSVAAQKISEIISKPIGNISLAIITSAATPAIKSNYDLFPEWLNEDIGNIKEHGFLTTFYTLENLTEEKIEEIKKHDVLYITGGNLFYLRYWIEKSKFLPVINHFAENKIYAGASAGAIVVTKDLAPYQAAEKIELAPELITTGLNLVDAHVLVHWHNPKHHQEIRNVADVYKKDESTKIFYIEDGQALLVRSGEFVQI